MRPSLTVLPLLIALLSPEAGGASFPEITREFNLNRINITELAERIRRSGPSLPRPVPDVDCGGPDFAEDARIESSVKVVYNEGSGRAEIMFPRTPGAEAVYGYRSYLFIRLEGEVSPVLSWATVFCSGGQYLGYKGASLEFPDGTGENFLLRDETLSVGPLKALLLKTHPWVAGGSKLDGLCLRGSYGKSAGYTLKSLPGRSSGLVFSYNKARNALTVTWQ